MGFISLSAALSCGPPHTDTLSPPDQSRHPPIPLSSLHLRTPPLSPPPTLSLFPSSLSLLPLLSLSSPPSLPLLTPSCVIFLLFSLSLLIITASAPPSPPQR